jgi:hypothetical protein
MAPDFANAMALFYSKKTSERAELVTIRKYFEEKIEKELRNFWWDILFFDFDFLKMNVALSF